MQNVLSGREAFGQNVILLLFVYKNKIHIQTQTIYETPSLRGSVERIPTFVTTISFKIVTGSV